VIETAIRVDALIEGEHVLVTPVARIVRQVPAVELRAG